MKATHTSLLSLLIMFGSIPLFATPQVDPAFQANISGTVHAIATTPDGRIVVGGEFSQVNGQASANIIRLDSNGSIDGAFSATTDGTVLSLRSGADGSIFAGGAFNTPTRHLLRLNPAGELDLNFPAADTTASRVTCIAVDGQGSILVGGPFRRVGNLAAHYITKFDIAGLPDGTFTSGLSPNYSMEAGANAIAVQPDGKILLAGNLSLGADPVFLVRLNADGSVDDTFSGDNGPMLNPKCIVLLAEGKILVAGTLNTSGEGFVRRLNPDGSVDPSFQSEPLNDAVECVAIDSTGRIILGGNFEGKLARLNPDGSLDSTWNVDANGAVRSIVLQPDGAILVGGAFTRIAGQDQKGIARLRGTRTDFQSFATNENGRFTARLQTMPGRNYAIEFSEDLRTWSAAGTAIATELGVEVTDGEATHRQRFYRARLLN